MRRRGHSAEAIDKLIYQNPMRFLSQNSRFKIAT
jgi:predicted metal-dependent phosphotriesterase family hydrolase